MPAYTKLSGAHLHDGDTPTANTPNAALNVYRHNRGHSMAERNISRLNLLRTVGEWQDGVLWPRRDGQSQIFEKG